jgi:hypothetical protein
VVRYPYFKHTLPFGRLRTTVHKTNTPFLTFSRNSINLRDIYITEYIHDLMSNAPFWELVPTYINSLTNSTFQKAVTLSQFLLRQEISSENFANKLIHVCKQYDLKDNINQAYKILAIKALKRNKFAICINYLKLSKDASRLSSVTNKIVKDLQKGKKGIL